MNATSAPHPEQAESIERPAEAEEDEQAEPATVPAAKRRRRRRLKIVLGGTALTLAAAAGVGYLWLNAISDAKNLGKSDCNAVTPTVTATPAGAPSADDRRAVCRTLRSMTQAWARHDAIAYGDHFTQDATYISYIGTVYQGRRDIAEGHRALFDGFLKGTKLADSWLSVRFYGPDTAVATSRGDTYKGGEPKAADLSKAQTYTLVRQGEGTWRIAAFQNTKRQRVMERISFLISPDTKPEAEK
ncbi:SgcJ/EcaC family oxidoreductase [Streptomyces sp. NPDC059063]|uniref:SgcJ/EcaC family oxidoreductase n=1 Tax=unclassified Streptomyces TaxID=2593676 RepID=UPI0036833FCE